MTSNSGRNDGRFEYETETRRKRYACRSSDSDASAVIRCFICFVFESIMNAHNITCEAVTIDSILYRRGNICKNLEGFHAWLYRAMIKRYGEAEATERFWWLWHKKESPNCNHHEAERATYNDI